MLIHFTALPSRGPSRPVSEPRSPCRHPQHPDTPWSTPAPHPHHAHSDHAQHRHPAPAAGPAHLARRPLTAARHRLPHSHWPGSPSPVERLPIATQPAAALIQPPSCAPPPTARTPKSKNGPPSRRESPAPGPGADGNLHETTLDGLRKSPAPPPKFLTQPTLTHHQPTPVPSLAPTPPSTSARPG